MWIVKGHTGEFSDYMSWDVVAYHRKEDAQRHANLANNWAKENGISSNISWEKYKNLSSKLKNPWDKNMCLDYTGVEYDISEVKLQKIVKEMT